MGEKSTVICRKCGAGVEIECIFGSSHEVVMTIMPSSGGTGEDGGLRMPAQPVIGSKPDKPDTSVPAPKPPEGVRHCCGTCGMLDLCTKLTDGDREVLEWACPEVEPSEECWKAPRPKTLEERIVEPHQEEIETMEFLIRRYANGDEDRMTEGAVALKTHLTEALNNLGWYRAPEGTDPKTASILEQLTQRTQGWKPSRGWKCCEGCTEVDDQDCLDEPCGRLRVEAEQRITMLEKAAMGYKENAIWLKKRLDEATTELAAATKLAGDKFLNYDGISDELYAAKKRIKELEATQRQLKACEENRQHWENIAIERLGIINDLKAAADEHSHKIWNDWKHAASTRVIQVVELEAERDRLIREKQAAYVAAGIITGEMKPERIAAKIARLEHDFNLSEDVNVQLEADIKHRQAEIVKLCGQRDRLIEDNKKLADEVELRVATFIDIQALFMKAVKERDAVLAEPDKLRSSFTNHNLADPTTKHVHKLCPCNVPAYLHCQLCGTRINGPPAGDPDIPTCLFCHQNMVRANVDDADEQKFATSDGLVWKCPTGCRIQPLAVPIKDSDPFDEFLAAMRAKFNKALTKDDKRSKTPWATYELGWLMERLGDEWCEWLESVSLRDGHPIKGNPEELLDIANFCMFVWKGHGGR